MLGENCIKLLLQILYCIFTFIPHVTRYFSTLVTSSHIC